jgi:hypothetical protein
MQDLRRLVLLTALRAKIKEAGYKYELIYYGDYALEGEWLDPITNKLHNNHVVTGFNVTVRPPIRKYPTHTDRKHKRKMVVPIRDKIPKALGMTCVYYKLATRTNGEDEVILTTT